MAREVGLLMTRWQATIKQNEAGLRLRFLRPVQELDLTREGARRLATALLLAAEGEAPATIRSENLIPAEGEHDG